MSEEEEIKQQQKTKVSRLAMASLFVPISFFLVCFIWDFKELFKPFVTSSDILYYLGLCCLRTFLIGYILALSALLVLRKSKVSLRGKGFAIAGIVFSSIQFLISLLASVNELPYTHQGGRYLAQKTYCQLKLKNLGSCLFLYSCEYEHQYPTPDKWCDLLIKNESYSLKENKFRCPACKDSKCSYAINPNCKPASPNDVVLLFESKGWWNQFGRSELLNTENHEGKGCNILFNDGHVEFVEPEDFNDLKWKTDANQ